ncbi:hypothetical protein PR202_ga19990 [Eleusine coracana subsp. coracana]|uniref:Uncharacterized protein n=1 Tax=Eleusine coracana subsp. coracana TaxID=191504 RepID=A0AAV5CXX4_ELECO|nr:hypothetical protein PR202_ga19990 [Eleusine coracana subsp. coracana]
MGIDPVTHKSFSHLMAEIATTLAPPQVAHLAEAALGCFKDEMLHLLTKKRPTDFHPSSSPAVAHDVPAQPGCFLGPPPPQQQQQADDTVERIKMGLSRAIMSEPAAVDKQQQPTPPWAAPADMSEELAGMYAAYNPGEVQDEFRYEGTVSEYVLGGGGHADQGTSMWSHQSMYSASSGTEAPRPAVLEKGNDSVGSSRGEDDMDEDDKEGDKGGAGSDISGLFGSDCVLWDLPDELTNHLV